MVVAMVATEDTEEGKVVEVEMVAMEEAKEAMEVEAVKVEEVEGAVDMEVAMEEVKMDGGIKKMHFLLNTEEMFYIISRKLD